MAEQTIALPSSIYFGGFRIGWDFSSGNRPNIIDALAPGDSRFLDFVEFDTNAGQNPGRVGLNFAIGQSGDQNADLSDLFETQGHIRVVVGNLSITVSLAGMDTADPYQFIPSNAAEVAAFATAVAALSPGPSATIVISDQPPTTAVDHAVDAGAASFAFAVPQPTVTHIPPGVLLTLADWTQPADTENIVLALIQAPAIITEPDFGDFPVGSPLILDGEVVVASDLTLVMAERHSSGIRLRKTGAAGFSTYFDNEGNPQYPAAKLYIQTSASEVIPLEIAATGGGFNNWTYEDDADRTNIEGISAGDRFILAITTPSSAAVDHAVDAGTAEFSFAVPEPSVTHTTAASVDHAVDAGEAAFAFAVPQPTVTHTPVSGTAHAVDAAAASWEFTIPEPTVTSGPVTVRTGKTLVLTAPIPASAGVNVGDLLAFGELGKETIDGLVVGVEPATEISARIAVMPWQSPGVYDSETGAIPPFVSGISGALAARDELEILSVNSGESVLRLEGSIFVPVIAIEVRPIAVPDAYIEAQIRPAGTESWASANVLSRAPSYIEIGDVVEGSDYDIRLRWFPPGLLLPGEWTLIAAHTVTGRTNPPGPLTNFVVTAESGGYTVSWTIPDDIDLAGVIVYSGTSGAPGFEIGRVDASYFRANSLPSVEVHLWARAVDTGGRLGPLSGPLAVTALDPEAGSTVHDIGSADAPDADLGKPGDTAINDAGEYWFKTPTGWDPRGDLTDARVYFSDDLIAAGHSGTLPPPGGFGSDRDIAIGPNGRVMRRENGAWIDVTLDIPAPSNLSAVYTIISLTITGFGATVYDLHVDWAGADYLTEVDIGFIPTVDITNLTSARWGSLDGVSATSFHDFPLIRELILLGRAVRCRHIGSFGQRGPYSYALYNSSDVLSATFSANPDSIRSGQSAVLSWSTTRAASASIDHGVGNVSVPSGTVSVSPTQTTTYTLTATDSDGNTVERTVTVTVTTGLAQPRINSFSADDSTLIEDTESTRIRWTTTNGVSGILVGPGSSYTIPSGSLPSGSRLVGPFSTRGNKNFKLTITGEAGTADVESNLTINVIEEPVDPVTIDSFTRDDASIVSGESTVIRWSTSNARSVTINGATVSDDGTQTVSPTSDTDYVLRATGPGGPVTRTISVEVTDPPSDDPEVVSFSATATAINQGESVTLSWVTRNGDSRKLISRRVGESTNDIDDETIPASGSRTDTPTAATTYRVSTWNAADPSGTVDFEDITVTVNVAAPVIDSFSISPTTIDADDSVTFTWATTGAVRVRATMYRTDIPVFVDTIFNSTTVDGSETHTLPTYSAGQYVVTLIAYNADDDSVTATRALTIN